MRTRQNLLLLYQIIIFALFLAGMAAGEAAHAEVLECEVGDTSKGNWQKVFISEECLIPGPPAEDSPWPQIPLKVNPRVYRIEGIYKISSTMGGEGWSWEIPPPRPGCITGFAEAYAAATCTDSQNWCNASPTCHDSYTATGTLCIRHFSNSQTKSKNYARFFDRNFILLKWKCISSTPEPPKQNHNLGAPFCELSEN